MFDEEEEGEDSMQVESLSPSPPSYPDPFGTNGNSDATLNTTNRNRVLQPPDEDDDEEIQTTPWEDYLPKLNMVTLSGRIGKDPEPRYFEDGKVVVNLSLACKRKYHPLERLARDIKSGEEETDWFGLEIWGRDAEYAARYVSKGMRVGITGSLVIDTFTDKTTGGQRTSPKIIVKHLDILETRAESELRKRNLGKSYTSNTFKSNRSGDNDIRGDNQDYDDGKSNASAGSDGFFD